MYRLKDTVWHTSRAGALSQLGGPVFTRPSPSVSFYFVQFCANVCGTGVARRARARVMLSSEHQRSLSDRRRVPRGGRRPTDRPGKYPPVLVAESYDGVRMSCARYLDRFHFHV